MRPIHRRILAAAMLVAALITGLTTVSAQGQGKSVTFDVGEPQGIDSMSPLIGVVVPAFEAWNIQYATLTDKAASDFHTIPGLAESWKGSDDKLTWTYKLRPNLKWSDGKPLTSEDIAWNVNTSREEEWLNHSAVTANLTATRAGPADGRDQDLRAGSEAPDDGRLHPPQAHLGQAEPGRARQVRGRGRRGLRPVRAREVREGPVRPLQGEPELLGREARGRHGRAPEVQQPGRDGRRAQDG